MSSQDGHLLINVHLNGTHYQRNLGDDLNIDFKDLPNELIRQPYLYGWYGALRAIATERVTRGEATLIKIESEGMEHEMTSRVKLSNDKIMAKVRSTPVYLKAAEELVQSKRQLEVLENAVKAMQMRKDMLVLLASMASHTEVGLDPNVAARMISRELEDLTMTTKRERGDKKHG